MDIIRLCAWGYAALLGFVILTGYIPAFIDANDMIFGLFRRTWYADGLHLVSALWAAAAAITSRRPRRRGDPDRLSAGAADPVRCPCLGGCGASWLSSRS